LVALGDFEGGELCFPQLQIIVPLRNFTKIYKDRKDGIERDVNGLVIPMIPQQNLNDANGLNRQVRLNKPKANQIRVPPASTDCRRGRIGRRKP